MLPMKSQQHFSRMLTDGFVLNKPCSIGHQYQPRIVFSATLDLVLLVVCSTACTPLEAPGACAHLTNSRDRQSGLLRCTSTLPQRLSTAPGVEVQLREDPQKDLAGQGGLVSAFSFGKHSCINVHRKPKLSASLCDPRILS